jgi:hypothetical protein
VSGEDNGSGGAYFIKTWKMGKVCGNFFRYALVLSSGGAIADFIGVPQNGHLFSKARLLSEM